MEEPRPILYGVSDYAQIRKKNAYAKIRHLVTLGHRLDAAIVELKYLKPGDPEPPRAALAAIKAEAVDQLNRYSADPKPRAKWQLKGGKAADLKPEGRLKAAEGGDLTGKEAAGSVSLHRLVLVFRGGDCLLAEEA